VLAHQQEVKEVEYLPFDVDGDCASKVSCIKAQMMKTAKDGRPWKKWVTSNRGILFQEIIIVFFPALNEKSAAMTQRLYNASVY